VESLNFAGKYVIMRPLFLLLSLLVAVFFGHSALAQPVINEFSNGPSGAKEFVEIVAVGPPGGFVDLRGWIFDDNSGFYGCGSGQGIASGYVRFDSVATWACVPSGSIILLYNGGDVHPAITLPDDPTDANNDKVYVIGLGTTPSSNMSFNQTTPTASSCNTYLPFPAPGSGGSWGAQLGLSNVQDGATLVDPANLTTYWHGVAYGGLSSPPPVYFTGGGAQLGFAFQNTLSNNWNLVGNWVSHSYTLDNPGVGNNAANQAWIDSLRTPNGSTITASPLTGCSPLQVSFQTSQAGTNFVWTYGDGTSSCCVNTATHTYTSTGTFHAVLTYTTPNGCSAMDSVTIITTTASTPVALGSTICNGDAATLTATGGTGTYQWFTAPTGGTAIFNGNPFSPSPTANTTYYVANDSNSACANFARTPVSVTVVAAPSAHFTLTVPNPFCAPYSTTITFDSANGNLITTGPVSVTGNTVTFTGQGNSTIAYTVSNSICTRTFSQSFNAAAAPSAAFTVDTNLCVGEQAVLNPPGGTYSGTGVSGNIFSATTVGNFLVTHVVTNGTCNDTSTRIIHVVSSPDASFTGINGDLCISDAPISFTPANGTYIGLGVTGNTFNPSVAGPGTHQITHIVSNGACQATVSQDVTVVAPLPISFLLPDSVCLEVGSLSLTATPGNGTFSGPGVAGNLLSFTTTGKYTVTYSISSGCAADTTASVYVKRCIAPVLIVPNVFSPNGDGVNDTWHVDANVGLTDFQLEVFNRWGQVVYSSKNAQPYWNGDGVVEGEYYFVLKANMLGQAVDRKGFVRIVR